MVACDTIAGGDDAARGEAPNGRVTATIAGMRLTDSHYISAWHSGRRGGKRDGRGGAGPGRSYLTTMRRSYQRTIQRAGRQRHASCEANLRGVHPVWRHVNAHLRRGWRKLVACDTSACREDAVWDEAPDCKVRTAIVGVRLKDSSTISAWPSGGRGGRSDERGGAGLVRRQLETMRWSYQRKTRETRRHWHASRDVILCGVHSVWQQISAHFLRSLSNMVARDTIAGWEDAVWDEASADKVPALFGRHKMGSNDARSGYCRSRSGEGGCERRWSAILISGKRPGAAMG